MLLSRITGALSRRRLCRRLRRLGVTWGRGLWMHPTVHLGIAPGGSLTIGDGVFFGPNVSLNVAAGASVTIGDGCQFFDGARVVTNGEVVIGANAVIQVGSILASERRVTIGADALIAPYAFISDHGHAMDRLDIPISRQGNSPGDPVEIGPGAWIGTKATVMPGVTVGEGAVIGANAVVTKSVPTCEIWAGVPARFHRSRGPAAHPSTKDTKEGSPCR